MLIVRDRRKGVTLEATLFVKSILPVELNILLNMSA